MIIYSGGILKSGTAIGITPDCCCGEEPCTCCFELVPWSAGECDKSEVPGFVDDIGLTAVGVSVDPWCNGVTLTLTLTFTNASGFDNSGAGITFDLSSIGTTVTCTFASDGGIITAGPSIAWVAGAWPNGASLVRTLQLTHTGCVPGIGSITSQAYAAGGYICSVGWLPVECPPVLPPQPCTECTSATFTASPAEFSFDITNIESSTLSSSSTSLQTGDLFTLTATLSMVGNNDTESGSLIMSAEGITILSASPNGSGNNLPPVISNTDVCVGESSVTWVMTLLTGESYTLTAQCRFNGCSGGPSAGIRFTWDSVSPGMDQTILWAYTCAGCP